MPSKNYSAEEHKITLDQIDPDAAFIVRELKEHGYDAYIVGGCVRDLLAGRLPKDFDISTSALPEQIKAIFRRRCLLIGRRFRLAHIRFGKKVFEVSTFRSGENDSDSLILRDNQWGSAEEDVLRRDFTINGLFFDPESGTVIDYVNGLEDIHKKLIHCIGDPFLRFKQDPVRMIRALKFKARFGFAIEENSLNAINSCKEEILKASPARVLEELYRMLESGYALPFFTLLDFHGFLPLLFPIFTQENADVAKKLFFSYLKAIDLLIQQKTLEKPGRPALLACLLFPFLTLAIEAKFPSSDFTPKLSDTLQITYELVEEFCCQSFVKPSKRHKAALNFLLSMQHRFTPFGKKAPIRPSLIRQEDFKWSLQFLKLRALLEEGLFDLYYEWKVKRLESLADTPIFEEEEEKPRRWRGRKRFAYSGRRR